jgi:hypothetical protein
MTKSLHYVRAMFDTFLSGERSRIRNQPRDSRQQIRTGKHGVVAVAVVSYGHHLVLLTHRHEHSRFLQRHWRRRQRHGVASSIFGMVFPSTQ